jgi:ABC-type branched-subunit amino acid transport system substrate-binding protein
VGRIAFDERGDLKQQRVFIFQVKDSAFVQVGP